MRGLVFTKFLQHVDDRYGPVVTERMIVDSNVASNGAYTAVGNYPHSELVELVTALHAQVGGSTSELVESFGETLGDEFRKDFPEQFAQKDYFDFVESVDSTIHRHVRKLYPDAELPVFTTLSRDETNLVLRYESERGFTDLAKGILQRTAEQYGETISISVEKTPTGAIISLQRG